MNVGSIYTAKVFRAGVMVPKMNPKNGIRAAYSHVGYSERQGFFNRKVRFRQKMLLSGSYRTNHIHAGEGCPFVSFSSLLKVAKLDHENQVVSREHILYPI